MTDQELVRQLQTAMSLLSEINRELQQRQKVSIPSNGKLAKAPSKKMIHLNFM